MANSDNSADSVFESLVDAGVLSTSNGWIQRAVVQHNPRLTLELAYSTTVVIDVTDRLMISITDLN
jgi:hypothetical protein